MPFPQEIFPVAGVKIGVANTGIQKGSQYDLTVFQLTPDACVAGVFTRNHFQAAPVQVCLSHLKSTYPIQALVINTGNANSGTGFEGIQKALTTCSELGKLLRMPAQSVLPFSTGVILEPLPIKRLVVGLPKAIAALDSYGWRHAARAIMTTDTLPKIISKRKTINGQAVTLTGISKGAGMIRPKMATMLAFIATDIKISQPVLNHLIHKVSEVSFNRITVDGDSSTNDSFIIIATGKSGVSVNSVNDPCYAFVLRSLQEAAVELAKKIVRDAEGATKFITIRVVEAAKSHEALSIAYSIAHSPLVKVAFFASDPNLGRILCAVGCANIKNLKIENIYLWMNGTLVIAKGARNPVYKELDGQHIMQQKEIEICIALGRGQVSETIYTCDLSHEYISINSSYRS